MASVNRVFQLAARLSTIGKGDSLNDRDHCTRLSFSGNSCEIISGGLFAIASVIIPLDVPFEKPLAFEIDNLMLKSIAAELDVEDLAVKGIYSLSPEGNKELSQVEVTSKGVSLIVPSWTRWNGFVFGDLTMIDFTGLKSSIMSAILSSVPKLRQDDNEKRILSAMRLEAQDRVLTAQSTNNNRIIVSLTVPCSESRLRSVLIPFTIVPLLRWAIEEFKEERCQIGLLDESVYFRCGDFRCVIKQIVSAFPPVGEALANANHRRARNNGFKTERLLFGAKQAAQLGHQACTIKVARDSRFEAGSQNERFSTALVATSEVKDGEDVEISLDSAYLTAAMTCFSKLGFEEAPISYVGPKDAVLFSAQYADVAADIVIATMDRVAK